MSYSYRSTPEILRFQPIPPFIFTVLLSVILSHLPGKDVNARDSQFLRSTPKISLDQLLIICH